MEHVVKEHGAKRTEARKYMACVKPSAKGQLKYYAVKFGSPFPGDIIQKDPQRREMNGKFNRPFSGDIIQKAKQNRKRSGRLGRLSVFNNLLVSTATI
jgi:hypothetical protein